MKHHFLDLAENPVGDRTRIELIRSVVDPVPEVAHSGVDARHPGKPAVDAPGDDADDVPVAGHALADERRAAVALTRVLPLLASGAYLGAGWEGGTVIQFEL